MESPINFHRLKAGSLLLAEPFMWDPNFRRGVVLVCEHDEEDGAVGLLLNRPLALELSDITTDGWPSQIPLYYGGPVGQDSVYIVHRYSRLIADSRPIIGDIAWSGDFDQIKYMLQKGQLSLDRLRFYLGYTGWDIEQLKGEITQGSWMMTKAKSDYVFSQQAPSLWAQILNDMGGNYKLIANYPENPQFN